MSRAIASIPFELLDSARQLPQEQFLAQILSEGRSLRDVLAHTLITEQHWIGHVVLGGERCVIEPEDFKSADDLERAWRPVRERTVQFLRDVTPDRLAEMIVDEYEPHITYSIELVLWHLVTHEFYHAGEICLHLGLNHVRPSVPEIIR